MSSLILTRQRRTQKIRLHVNIVVERTYLTRHHLRPALTGLFNDGPNGAYEKRQVSGRVARLYCLLAFIDTQHASRKRHAESGTAKSAESLIQ